MVSGGYFKGKTGNGHATIMNEQSQSLIEAAITAARAAEDIILFYYQRRVEIELKADATPVTVADKEAEHAIKRVLAAAFPGHGFWGEETGREGLDAEYIWLIDPIDGTKSFVRDYPFFSTQLALLHKGRIILGVSNAPIFGELARASLGQGAFLNDQTLHVSTIDRFENAILSFGNIKSLIASRPRPFAHLVASCNRIRGYGDFYHGHLLAAGKIDMVLESDVNILDIAALSLIITEAGGQVSDLDGGPIGLDSTSFVASNAVLHAPLLAALAQ